MFRVNRYFLPSLMIALMLSGLPIADCNQNEILGEVHTLTVEGIDPPTIQWTFADENATVGTGMYWDGSYTGQTELTWAYSSWINDTDGVDTVRFHYRYNMFDSWDGWTPSMVEGNSTCGKYSYTFTQQISWDWDSNSPQVENGLYVEFCIFANDSLGNWRITPKTFKSGGWLDIVPPPSPFNIPLEIWWVIGTAVVAIIAVVVVYRKGPEPAV